MMARRVDDSDPFVASGNQTIPMSSGDKVLVRVIGRDGIMRSEFHSRKLAAQTGFFWNKYRYTPDDVFLQRLKKWDLFPYDQPTIMFYEGSPDAVPRHMKDTFVSPDEISVDIGNAAMAIATILKGKEDTWKNLILILCIISCALAGGAAGLGYMNYKTLGDMKESGTGVYANSTYNVQPEPTQIIPQNTPKPTPVVTPGATPTPQVTVLPKV